MNRKNNGWNRKYYDGYEENFDNLKYSPKNVLDSMANMHF